METFEMALNVFEPNPWQPREREDPEHIKQIALSIAQDGLMQVPVGRIVKEVGKPNRVQLAFGHSRLAAFKWLEEVKANSNLVGDWSRMPVVIRELSDDEMFRLGVGENLARKDLNPIEEARAMARYRDEFGKTSSEIGELFHLAESSVRNKMRLVNLPEDLQTALAEGRLSEGAGRVLLRLVALPEEMRQRGGDGFQMQSDGYMDGYMFHRSIVNRALDGATAELVDGMIDYLVQRNGKNLHEAKWKWEELFDLRLNPDLHAEQCKGCEMQTAIGKITYCTLSSCFAAKHDLWVKMRLARASVACGISTPDDWQDVGHINVAEEVRASGCKNLRVVYDPKPDYQMVHRVSDDGRVPGFDDCRIVCGNRNSICTCMNGWEARKKAEDRRLVQQAEASPTQSADRPELEYVPVEEAQPAQGPTAEDLRAAAREAREQDRQAHAELQAMREDFARRVYEGMVKFNRFAWYAILTENTNYALRHKRDEIGIAEDSFYTAALELATRETQVYDKVNLRWALKNLNELLAAMELPEMESGVEM